MTPIESLAMRIAQLELIEAAARALRRELDGRRHPTTTEIAMQLLDEALDDGGGDDE